MQFDGDNTRRYGKFVSRLKEPSSMGGLALLLTLFGVSDAQAFETTDIVVTTLTGIFSILAIFVPEKGGK